jgi:hypothetical protein
VQLSLVSSPTSHHHYELHYWLLKKIVDLDLHPH